MAFGNDKRQETITYLVLWGLLFLAPILSLHVRTVEDSTEVFDWNEVTVVWRQYAIYFAFFLIHNHLLAPMLVYRQRRVLYFSILATLVATFMLYQCSNRPMPDERHTPNRPKPEGRFMHEGRPMPDDRFFPEKPDGSDFPDAPKAPKAPIPDGSPSGPASPEAQFPPKRPAPPHPRTEPRHHPPLFVGQHEVVSLIVLLLMLGTNLGVKFYYRHRRDQRHLAELERQNLEQQLNYLRYQINPHFLMNTLNNIHALVDIDAEQAKATIVELSKMLRFVLYEGDKTTVPLSRELAFTEEYIKLMCLRYTEKVCVSFTKPDQLPNADVPPLILITFVENAFKHGVSYRQQSFVNIECSVSGDTFTFHCSNSRITDADDSHGGVGLQNVRKRLDLIYGATYTLLTEADADAYRVSLTIPLRIQDSNTSPSSAT